MKETLYGIEIDYERDKLFTPFAMTLLSNFYFAEGETSPQQSFARAAAAYSYGDMELAQKLYDYASLHYFTFASPVLSNAPKPGEPWKAMPISCFLLDVPDTVKGLIDHTSELRWLSVKGGGIGANWSKVRPSSKKAPGPIPFLKTVDSDMVAYKQGKTRKGSCSVYLHISHPDIVEFIQMKIPTGGDINRKCQELFPAVKIPDSFMQAALEDKPWDLIDPSTGSVRETISARKLLEIILETRARTGGPFIMFEDTVDAGVPVFQKALGAKVNNSNLCTEIVQVNGQIEGEPHQRTAVCCLASLNAAKMSKWIGTDIVRVLLRTLDNVIQRFIENAPDELANARWSASQERSVGIGLLGFHDMLQQNHIPFESAMAVGLNKSLFKFIHDEALAETIKLAEERGPCPDAAKSGAMIRNALRIAIAPNANSSIFVDASPSIETRSSNAYVHRTRAGTHLVKNVNLENYMISNGFEEARRERIWNSILEYDGSVQHLTQDFDEWTREVYKTAFEIDQAWVVQHAADRQEYIDQAQSVNLFMPPKSQRDYLLRVFFSAWKKGLKTLYYQRTATPSKAHKVSKKMERVPLSSILVEEDCIACQG